VLELSVDTTGEFYSIAGFLDIEWYSEQNTFQKLDPFPYKNGRKGGVGTYTGQLKFDMMNCRNPETVNLTECHQNSLEVWTYAEEDNNLSLTEQ